MDTAKDLAQLLETYGPWGITAVLIFAIFYLYRTTSTILSERNQQFISYLQTSGTTLANLSKTTDKLEEVMREVKELLRENKAYLETAKVLMDDVRRALSSR